MKIESKSNSMQLSFKFASNFPNKKLHFYTKINVCIFAYIRIILYLCNIKEEERILLELINEVLFKI